MMNLGMGWKLNGLMELWFLVMCLSLACLEPGVYPLTVKRVNAC
jgi:hypothetical protein